MNAVIATPTSDYTVFSGLAGNGLRVIDPDGAEHKIRVERGASIADVIVSSNHRLVRTVTEQEVVTYHTDDARVKPSIGQDIYDQLPESLKSLYSKQIERSEADEEIQFTIFSMDDYAQANPELYVYTAEDVARAVAAKSFAGVNNWANVELINSFSAGMTLRISFFDEEYKGATHKVLDRKKNGMPYADQRGKIVRTLPDVLAEIELPISSVPRMVAYSKAELDKKLDDYFRFITMAHMVPTEEI